MVSFHRTPLPQPPFLFRICCFFWRPSSPSPSLSTPLRHRMATTPLRRSILCSATSTTTRTMSTTASRARTPPTFQDPPHRLTPPAFYQPTANDKRPPHWRKDGTNGTYSFEAPWPSWSPRITSFWSFLQARYLDEGRQEWKEKPLPKTVEEGLPEVREACWREEGAGREDGMRATAGEDGATTGDDKLRATGGDDGATTGQDGATSGDDKLRLTWLGHASCHLQIPIHATTTTTTSLNVLMDPVFSTRCSPLSFMGPARFTPPPTTIEAMSRSDAAWPHVVVLSHNHYDHMDYTTIKTLLSRPNGRDQPLWLVPLGLKAWFEANCKELDSDKVVELDWWEEKVVDLDGGKVCFTLTPAQHFGARSATDRGRTLWGSWAMRSAGGANVWFSGDTGYRSIPRNFAGDEDELPSCPAFREIGSLLGPFDLALVACGAYQPRSMFSSVHADPREAVTIHQEIKARRSIGIHHSTWRLTSEDVDEPPRWFREEGRKRGLPEGEVDCMVIGETRVFAVGEGKEGVDARDGPKAAL